jgi:1,4-dihydroxy-2-naphthoate octaprenyltransferase
MWVEIVMMMSAIIYAGLKHLEVEDDIKVFFFLNCLLIIDIGIAVAAVVIFIALLLGLLVCVCVCLGVGYTFSSIRRSVNRKRRE